MNAKKYSSLSERLRPRTMKDLLLPDESILRLERMLQDDNVMNMIFYGSPGTGKTSCAKLICEANDHEVLYINASMSTGVDDIRKLVENFATSMSLFGGKKIVLLDESDYLSLNAQASLRGLIEKVAGHCRFILTANEIKKIQKPIQSRCLPICFDAASSDVEIAQSKLCGTIIERLSEIDKSISPNVLREIVAAHYPDFRLIANEIEFYLF
jgi:replication factor C subunit 3/5